MPGLEDGPPVLDLPLHGLDVVALPEGPTRLQGVPRVGQQQGLHLENRRIL